MKIQTDFEVPANVNVVWDMLDDPSVIEASIPRHTEYGTDRTRSLQSSYACWYRA